MGRTEIAIHTSASERELLQIRKVSWYLTQTVRHTFLHGIQQVEGCYFVSRDPFVTPCNDGNSFLMT